MKGNKYFVGEFDLSSNFYDNLDKNHSISFKKLDNIFDLSFFIKNLFSENEFKFLLKEVESTEWVPVGIDGILSNYKKNDNIGSYRASCYEKQLADILWKRLNIMLPNIRKMKKMSPTNWDNHYYWKPIGINPLFRFIKYTNSGFLVPHYDDSFVLNENTKSLSTLVVYLTNNNYGKTRFLKDKQTQLPLNKRDYSDQFFTPEYSDVLFENSCIENTAILFDHRVLHDCEKLINEEKIIIRTDIMYEKVNI